MTRKSLAPCLADGCGVLTLNKRCPEHSRTYRAEHRGNWQWVYSSPRWRAVRRDVLRAHPFCTREGCHELSAEVDHVIRLDDWPGDPYERSNLMALCKPHHSQKTASEVLRG